MLVKGYQRRGSRFSGLCNVSLMYGAGRFQTLAEIDDMDFGPVERFCNCSKKGCEQTSRKKTVKDWNGSELKRVEAREALVAAKRWMRRPRKWSRTRDLRPCLQRLWT